MTETELARLRARLQEHRPLPVPFATDGLRRAAVLVPLLLREEGAQLLFTVRSASLPHHAGQIAFPGGGGHDGETPERTACREAREEVGLDVPEAALLGRLSPLPSPANYVAVPVVAALPWPARLTLDPGEVAESFTVPLRELLNIRPTTEERPFRGSVRVLHRYLWRDRDIWGFTGNVLREFLSVASQARGGGVGGSGAPRGRAAATPVAAEGDPSGGGA